MKITLLMILLAGSTFESARSATVIRIKSATLGGVILQDRHGTPLGGGGPADGNGCLLEFGYYSFGNTSTPFSGEWTPLTGPNSVSGVSTTIGTDLETTGFSRSPSI